MTGRPALPPGTHGDISSRYLTPSRAEASAWFRDYDGVRRRVRRVGQTKTAAEHNLKAALRDWQRARDASGAITPNTTLSALADAWIATGGGDRPWASNTVETYGYIVANEVKPSLGGIRLSELRLAILNRAISKVSESKGPGAAKTMKTVLTGMCDLAISYESLDRNPIRDAVRIKRDPKKGIRSLTIAETEQLCDAFRSDERAIELDLPDLVEFMLGTGARIGEACAARNALSPTEGKPVLDMEAGTWEINATVVRIKGQGLTIQQRPKTAAGWRILALPPFAVAMINRRSSEVRYQAVEGAVFGSPLARALRDPSNTASDLRERLDMHGFGWVTSHVFRKTVATRLDEKGISARVIADQLGHKKPSMTMDVYMGRKVVSAEAARILDR